MSRSQELRVSLHTDETCRTELTNRCVGYLKRSVGQAIFQRDIFGARRMPSSSSTVSSATASATPTALSCPASNDTTFAAISYARFEIGCGYETAGGDIGRVYVEDLEECVQTCDGTDGCVAATLSGNKSPSLIVPTSTDRTYQLATSRINLEK